MLKDSALVNKRNLPAQLSVTSNRVKHRLTWWPWFRSLSLGKAKKVKKKQKKPSKINKKIEFKVQRACPLSHFPKQSNGLDWKLSGPNFGPRDLCLTPLHVFSLVLSPDSRKSQILLEILVFPVFFKYTFMKCFIQITCNDFHHKQS